jgi:hypothetical protein
MNERAIRARWRRSSIEPNALWLVGSQRAPAGEMLGCNGTCNGPPGDGGTSARLTTVIRRIARGSVEWQSRSSPSRRRGRLFKRLVESESPRMFSASFPGETADRSSVGYARRRRKRGRRQVRTSARRGAHQPIRSTSPCPRADGRWGRGPCRPRRAATPAASSVPLAGTCCSPPGPGAATGPPALAAGCFVRRGVLSLRFSASFIACSWQDIHAASIGRAAHAQLSIVTLDLFLAACSLAAANLICAAVIKVGWARNKASLDPAPSRRVEAGLERPIARKHAPACPTRRQHFAYPGSPRRGSVQRWPERPYSQGPELAQPVGGDGTPTSVSQEVKGEGASAAAREHSAIQARPEPGGQGDLSSDGQEH